MEYYGQFTDDDDASEGGCEHGRGRGRGRGRRGDLVEMTRRWMKRGEEDEDDRYRRT